YVDIYLPDLKYFDPELSARYSGARDYFAQAPQAVSAMISQTGSPVFDEDGIMQKGIIIRHMVLPGSRKNSISILRWIREHLPEEGLHLRLLSQYTPFYKICEYPQINRRLTTY